MPTKAQRSEVNIRECISTMCLCVNSKADNRQVTVTSPCCVCQCARLAPVQSVSKSRGDSQALRPHLGHQKTRPRWCWQRVPVLAAVARCYIATCNPVPDVPDNFKFRWILEISALKVSPPLRPLTLRYKICLTKTVFDFFCLINSIEWIVFTVHFKYLRLEDIDLMETFEAVAVFISLHGLSGVLAQLTFDHDHVDVNGADGGLRETLSFLQQVRNVSGGNPVIWLATKGHYLPNGHP